MKYKKLAGVVLSCAIAFSAMPTQGLAAGIEDRLIVKWNMEASEGVISDMSENHLNLTTTGTTIAEGVVDGCSQFTGSQQATCNNSSELGGLERFSMSCWIKRETPMEAGSEFFVNARN